LADAADVEQIGACVRIGAIVLPEGPWGHGARCVAAQAAARVETVCKLRREVNGEVAAVVNVVSAVVGAVQVAVAVHVGG